MVGDNSQKNLILYDANGKTVYTQQLTDMFTTLDLQKLTAGMYFVKITSTEGKVLHTEKIIKN